MKAIGIKMVELQPMRASMALSSGYKIGKSHPDDMGYEVTYPRNPNKVYQCDSLCRMQDKNGGILFT